MADGHLLCLVAIIKDSSVKVPFLTQYPGLPHTWILLLPTMVSQGDVADTILDQCLLPALHKRRYELVETHQQYEQRHLGAVKATEDEAAAKAKAATPDATGRPQRRRHKSSKAGAAAAASAPPAAPPKAIIIFDGEEFFLQALMARAAGLKSESIELVKLASSSSKVLQPCDVATSFMHMKTECSQPVPAELQTVLESAMELFKMLLHSMDSKSRATYINRVLLRMPQLVTCFSSKAITKSWALAGRLPLIWPHAWPAAPRGSRCRPPPQTQSSLQSRSSPR